MAIKFNGRKGPRWYFEVRWVKPKHKGSFPIFGIFGINKGFEVVIWPFYGVFGKIVKLRPAPLTPEEQKLAEELMKFEQDN